MKIYTRIVIDMATGETIAEESFDYSGPVALAMPSTGGSDPDSGGDDTGHGSDGASGGGGFGGDGGSGRGDEGGYGGFGGLGIGNPGSYGGQQSVGAPGFGGGYSGGYGGGYSNAGAIGVPTAADLPADESFGWLDALGTVGTVLGIAGMLTGNPALGISGLAARGISGLGNLAGQLGLSFDGSGTGGTISGGDPMSGNGGDSNGYLDTTLFGYSNPAAGGAATDPWLQTLLGGLAGSLGVSLSDIPGGDPGGVTTQQFLEAVAAQGGLPVGATSGSASAAAAGSPATDFAPGLTGAITSARDGYINDQMLSLFQGDAAPYNLRRMMQDYTTGVDAANAQYMTAAGGIADDWLDFEDRYRQAGANLTDDYQGVMSRYQTHMAGVQPLAVTLPGRMGGASIGLAPNRWGTYYGGQAQTEAGLLGDQADLLGQIANYESTGMANRQGLANQNFMNRMQAENALLTPWNQAANIFNMYAAFGHENDMQQSSAASQAALQQQQIDANTPSDWAVWAPIAVDAVNTIGNTDWSGVGDAIGGAIDWIGGLF